VNEVTKAVVAQYNAAELLTKREIVSRQVRDLLTQRSADFRILLDDVAITHLAFSKEYTAAVEAKQVAQQDSERAKYIVERAIQEKKSIVIRAEGEAKSAELIGNVSNPASTFPGMCATFHLFHKPFPIGNACTAFIVAWCLTLFSTLLVLQAIKTNPAFLQLRRIEASKDVSCCLSAFVPHLC
jgi:hypothetical protein